MIMRMIKRISIETEMLTNFILNDAWTFRHRGWEAGPWWVQASRLGRFHLVYMVGIILGLGMPKGQVQVLGGNLHLPIFFIILVVIFQKNPLNRCFGWVLSEAPEPMADVVPVQAGLKMQWRFSSFLGLGSVSRLPQRQSTPRVIGWTCGNMATLCDRAGTAQRGLLSALCCEKGII
jgi:hypothetical protein